MYILLSFYLAKTTRLKSVYPANGLDAFEIFTLNTNARLSSL